MVIFWLQFIIHTSIHCRKFRRQGWIWLKTVFLIIRRWFELYLDGKMIGYWKKIHFIQEERNSILLVQLNLYWLEWREKAFQILDETGCLGSPYELHVRKHRDRIIKKTDSFVIWNNLKFTIHYLQSISSRLDNTARWMTAVIAFVNMTTTVESTAGAVSLESVKPHPGSSHLHPPVSLMPTWKSTVDRQHRFEHDKCLFYFVTLFLPDYIWIKM